MPTIVSPSTHAQTESTTGFSYVFAGEQIREEITERLDVVGAGLAVLYGDLQGSGSDTLRITRFGGIGFAEAMTAMTGETDAIVPTGYTLGLDEITLGRYGLAKEASYTQQILERSDSVHLADMAAMVPMSWMATMRSAACTVASTFATGVGNSGLAWTYDDELDLIAAFHETEGFEQAAMANGLPVALRHADAYTDLREAIRSEPGLQGSAELQQAILGIRPDEGGSFNFLGIRNYSSFDVASSGGDHVGGAYMPGAIAWAVANTIPIEVQDPSRTVFVPEFGIVIERRSSGQVATASWSANAFFGMAKLSATLFPQFKLISVAH